jgi:hypothetical protein
MRRRRIASALAGALAAAACGYTAGFDLAERGLRTVHVQVVGNQTFRQRLEEPLTRQLYELLPIHTGLVLASAAGADAVLTVDILAVEGRSLVQGTLHPVEEGALDYEVRVALHDRRTGALVRSAVVRDLSEFRIPVDENERTAVREASADLARKIALALEPAF